MKILLVATLALFSVLVLSACSGPRPNRDDRPEVDTLMGRTWTAIQIDGKDVPTEPARITLELLEKKQIAGFSGVNRYFGAFTSAKAGAIDITGVGSTKMAGPPEAMANETALFGALDKATSYRLRGAILELRSGDRVLARFRG